LRGETECTRADRRSAGHRRTVRLSPSSTPLPSHRATQRFGNQALQYLLRARLLQAKLTVSDPHDAYEQEADRLADAVMCMPEPANDQAVFGGRSALARIQRLCPECEEGLHRQTMLEDDEPLVQSKREDVGR
jgi:hypothetical protein